MDFYRILLLNLKVSIVLRAVSLPFLINSMPKFDSVQLAPLTTIPCVHYNHIALKESLPCCLSDMWHSKPTSFQMRSKSVSSIKESRFCSHSFLYVKVVVPPLIFQCYCIFSYFFASCKSTFHFYYHIANMVIVEFFLGKGCHTGWNWLSRSEAWLHCIPLKVYLRCFKFVLGIPDVMQYGVFWLY